MNARQRILLNGLFGDRWETEEDMYSSMAYDLAEEQVVADNQMGLGLANANQDHKLADEIYMSIEPLIEHLATKILNDINSKNIFKYFILSFFLYLVQSLIYLINCFFYFFYIFLCIHYCLTYQLIF